MGHMEMMTYEKWWRHCQEKWSNAAIIAQQFKFLTWRQNSLSEGMTRDKPFPLEFKLFRACFTGILRILQKMAWRTHSFYTCSHCQSKNKIILCSSFIGPKIVLENHTKINKAFTISNNLWKNKTCFNHWWGEERFPYPKLSIKGSKLWNIIFCKK